MEAFEASGMWWLPQAPEDKTPGTLYVGSDGRAELALIGALSSPLDSANRARESEGSTVTITSSEIAESGIYPRILGQVENAIYTLDDCFRTQGKINLPGGIGSERVLANRAFRGILFEQAEDIEFHKIYAWIDWLAYWVMRSGLEESMEFRKSEDGIDQHSATTITIAPIDAEECQADGGMTVTLGQTYGIAGDHVVERRLTQDFYFSVDAGGLTPLSTLMERASDLRDLVSIGTGRPAGYSSVQLRHPDIAQNVGGNSRELPIDMIVAWQVVNEKPLKGLTAHDMFFTFPDFDGIEGVKRWLPVAARYRSALGRVMSTVYSDGMFVSDQLFNCAAALEAYDRIQHADDVYFVDRLERSAERAGTPFEALVGDVRKWATRCKDARNDVAHHKPGIMGASTNHLFLSKSAYWLFVLCLLRECEAPDAVFDRIAAHQRYQWLGQRVVEALR